MKIYKTELVQLGARYAEFDFDLYAIYAVLMVESAGSGFQNGKLVIQFEPRHFKRIYHDIHKQNPPTTGIWDTNKVGTQKVEWKAFNDAFRIDKTAAMNATSIGLMQVMGFNHKRCGFPTVDEFWDYAKASELNQLDLGLRYIVTDPKLVKALKDKDWDAFAYGYNGKNYKQYKYHTRLRDAYLKAQSTFNADEIKALIDVELAPKDHVPVPHKPSLWQRFIAWIKSLGGR